jgi:hypothetical protein
LERYNLKDINVDTRKLKMDLKEEMCEVLHCISLADVSSRKLSCNLVVLDDSKPHFLKMDFLKVKRWQFARSRFIQGHNIMEDLWWAVREIRLRRGIVQWWVSEGDEKCLEQLDDYRIS